MPALLDASGVLVPDCCGVDTEVWKDATVVPGVSVCCIPATLLGPYDPAEDAVGEGSAEAVENGSCSAALMVLGAGEITGATIGTVSAC